MLSSSGIARSRLLLRHRPRTISPGRGAPNSDRFLDLALGGGVISLASLAEVATRAAVERVLARLAEEGVLALPAFQRVLAGTAADDVVPCQGPDGVVAAQGGDNVSGRRPGDLIGAVRTDDGCGVALAGGFTITLLPDEALAGSHRRAQRRRGKRPRRPKLGVKHRALADRELLDRHPVCPLLSLN